MEELEIRPGTTLRRFALAALVAVELLMSFSFLGYFHVEPISVTTAYLPVLLAGRWMCLPTISTTRTKYGGFSSFS